MAAGERFELMPANTPSQPTTWLIHVAFVLTGIMTTLLDPLLPVLSARWKMSDAQAGHLFTAQFLGSMLGVALSGGLVRKFGYRTAMATALGVLATGAIAMGATLKLPSTWTMAIVTVSAYGIGLGLTMPTANLLIAELNPMRRAAALSWLNFSWGVGAAVCPFAVALLVAVREVHLLLFTVAAPLLVLCLWLTRPSMPFPKVFRKEQTSATTSGVWRSPLAFALGALFYLYVGTENCVGGWVASYAQRMHPVRGTFWAVTPAFFWMALLAGRALAPGLLRYVEETALAKSGLLVAFTGLVGLVSAHSVRVLLTSAAVIGLGLAPVFPVNIALLSRRFGKLTPNLGSVMFALAGLGGATMPSLVGTVSTRFGGLKAGLYLPLAGCATMLVLYVGTARSLKAKSGPVPEEI